MDFVDAPAHKRHTTSTDNTTKFIRLPNIDSAYSFNIGTPFNFKKMIDMRSEDRLSEQLQSTIKEMFHEYEDRLLHEIDKRFNIVRTDLDNLAERVTALEICVSEMKHPDTLALTDDTDELKREIARLKENVKKHENSLVATDIRITGVPEQEDENLVNLFSKICEEINIRTPNIASAFRVRTKKSITNDNNFKLDASIVVKFLSPYDRNYFLKSVTSFIKSQKDVLRLNILGFDSTAPFYVIENLSPENHRILLQSRRLKKGI